MIGLKLDLLSMCQVGNLLIFTVEQNNSLIKHRCKAIKGFMDFLLSRVLLFPELNVTDCALMVPCASLTPCNFK